MADQDLAFGWAAQAGNALVAPHMEYHRKNRWVLEFTGLPAGLASINGADVTLRLNLYSAARPSMNFDETMVHRINGEVALPGKPHFDPLQVSFYDNVPTARAPAAEGNGMDDSAVSVSGIMEAWRQLMYQPTLGDAFGAVPNFKGQAFLHMLGPSALEPQRTDGRETSTEGGDWTANIAQTWTYIGMFPQQITYGDLSYDSSDVQMVDVTFRYDRAFLTEQ